MTKWRDIMTLAQAVCAAAWLTAALAPTGVGAAERPHFTVQEAQLRLVDGVYQLRATLNYVFPDAVLEALNNGVPLVLRLEIELARPRDYLWAETVADLRQRYRVKYHALTEQYVVTNLNSGAQETYPTLDMMLAALGHVPNLPVIDKQLLAADEHYRARLRAYLEFDELPVPLRLTAYVSRIWWLGSEWYEFAVPEAAAGE